MCPPSQDEDRSGAAAASAGCGRPGPQQGGQEGVQRENQVTTDQNPKSKTISHHKHSTNTFYWMPLLTGA